MYDVPTNSLEKIKNRSECHENPVCKDQGAKS